MSILSTTIIAFGMSADAFTAAVGKGITMRKPKISEAMRVGMIFGVVETITPLIGWSAGVAASGWITSIDHWIAFFILSIIGGKMIFESLKKEKQEQQDQHKFSTLILTAIGTSIDALAVGVTLAFMDVSILVSALTIGLATFVMATVGIMTGHYLGLKAGKIAEALGGFGLIFIGSSILIEHLGLWP